MLSATGTELNILWWRGTAGNQFLGVLLRFRVPHVEILHINILIFRFIVVTFWFRAPFQIVWCLGVNADKMKTEERLRLMNWSIADVGHQDTQSKGAE